LPDGLEPTLSVPFAEEMEKQMVLFHNGNQSINAEQREGRYLLKVIGGQHCVNYKKRQPVIP